MGRLHRNLRYSPLCTPYSPLSLVFRSLYPLLAGAMLWVGIGVSRAQDATPATTVPATAPPNVKRAEKVSLATELEQKVIAETKSTSEIMSNLTYLSDVPPGIHDPLRDQRVDGECLEEVARTSAEGHIGDGKIFVVPMEQAIQISDGYRGKGAI